MELSVNSMELPKQLPYELWKLIAFNDVYAWKAIVFSVPSVFRNTTHKEVLKKFRIRKKGKTYIVVGKKLLLHSFDDKSAVKTKKCKKWYYNGLLHRNNDRPAIVWKDGTQEWYWRGKLHRGLNKPAIIESDGTQTWCQFGGKPKAIKKC